MARITNWWGGKIPTANSEVVVKGCTTCPQLEDTKEVRRLWIEDAVIESNAASMIISEDVTVQTSTFEGDVVLVARDFLDFSNNTSSQNLLIKKTGGIDNSWKGGNRYKGELRILNTSDKLIVTATQANDMVKK